MRCVYDSKCWITDYDIGMGLANGAFTKVLSTEFKFEFKCTNLFDRHLFSNLAYLVADMTNISLE